MHLGMDKLVWRECNSPETTMTEMKLSELAKSLDGELNGDAAGLSQQEEP